MPIRVLIADDHPIVRSGIRNELGRQPDIEVVGEATNGDAALSLSQALQPNVLLLDINMAGMKAVHVIRELQSGPCSPAVLIVTAYGDPENVLGMLKAGAIGYLLKDEDPASIAQGVRAVAQGRIWLSASIAANLIGRSSGDDAAPLDRLLSTRQLEVLRLVAKGCTNHQIADQLAISERTVKNHVTSLYDQLGVHSRAEAVAWAWRHKVITNGC